MLFIAVEKKISAALQNGLNSPMKIITTSGQIAQTVITNTRMIPANKLNLTSKRIYQGF